MLSLVQKRTDATMVSPELETPSARSFHVVEITGLCMQYHGCSSVCHHDAVRAPAAGGRLQRNSVSRAGWDSRQKIAPGARRARTAQRWRSIFRPTNRVAGAARCRHPHTFPPKCALCTVPGQRRCHLAWRVRMAATSFSEAPPFVRYAAAPASRMAVMILSSVCMDKPTT